VASPLNPREILALSSERSQFCGAARKPEIQIVLQNPRLIEDMAEPIFRAHPEI
jgi:hypothetical protein